MIERKRLNANNEKESGWLRMRMTYIDCFDFTLNVILCILYRIYNTAMVGCGEVVLVSSDEPQQSQSENFESEKF